MNRFLHGGFWLTGIFPVSFCTAILAFFFHARNVLGHFPGYNNPDPKQLAFYGDYSIFVDLTFSAWFGSILFWLGLVIYVFVKRHTRSSAVVKSMVFTSLFHLAAIAILFSEITTWYLD